MTKNKLNYLTERALAFINAIRPGCPPQSEELSDGTTLEWFVNTDRHTDLPIPGEVQTTFQRKWTDCARYGPKPDLVGQDLERMQEIRTALAKWNANETGVWPMAQSPATMTP